MKSLADHLREIERTERLKYLCDHPAKGEFQKLRRRDEASNHSWRAVAREARKIVREAKESAVQDFFCKKEHNRRAAK